MVPSRGTPKALRRQTRIYSKAAPSRGSRARLYILFCLRNSQAFPRESKNSNTRFTRSPPFREGRTEAVHARRLLLACIDRLSRTSHPFETGVAGRAIAQPSPDRPRVPGARAHMSPRCACPGAKLTVSRGLAGRRLPVPAHPRALPASPRSHSPPAAQTACEATDSDSRATGRPARAQPEATFPGAGRGERRGAELAGRGARPVRGSGVRRRKGLRRLNVSGGVEVRLYAASMCQAA